MKITFQTNYNTVWGERLMLIGSCTELGGNSRSLAIPMVHEGNGLWRLSIEIENTTGFTYRYFILKDNNTIVDEWGDDRVASTPKDTEYLLIDSWRVNSTDKAFYSCAFSEGLISHKPVARKASIPAGKKIIGFSISDPQVSNGTSLAIVGNCEQLGNWNPSEALMLSDKEFPVWTGFLKAEGLPNVIEYKYVVIDNKTKDVLSWEYGDNRFLHTAALSANINIKNDEIVRHCGPALKYSGVAIPIFSLRTSNSFGIGEFLDLKEMVDWAEKTGMKAIQTLPINDTTRFHSNSDSYPYSAITVMGLHPIYINVFAMGTLADSKKIEYFKTLQAKYEQSPTVMYEEVAAAKWEYFNLIFKQEGAKVMASKGYKEFFNTNKEWLVPYAAFCYLRDEMGTADFHKWGDYENYEVKAIEKLFTNKATADKANIHLYLQYIAHIQLTEASKYALSKGVVLKGDIPIGISPESVEAWMEPNLFNLNSQAGAPPDPFSETGQNWGFPTYNWEAMARDGYTWWKKRFKKMEAYFQVYRIDHVLGFFRIWRMSSEDVQGLLGHFDPALPLSEDDIRNYGMWFEFHRMVHPYIREYMLDEIFGEYASLIRSNFLDLVTSGIYRFKEKYSTQRKMEKYFRDKGSELKLGDKTNEIYNKLLSLYCEVLFIEDSKQKGLYHPRIGLQKTHSFNDLEWKDKEALNNLYNDFFYHRHNQFWGDQAMKKLPALLGATGMLCCAEDLGMIPDCVPMVMQQLQMLSLEIERMPKDPKYSFVQLDRIPYLSVCTSSTHDMAPIRGWWKEDRQLIQNYYNYALGQQGDAPQKCTPEVAEMIVTRHLNSPAMLVILPLQDWLSIDGNIRRENEDDERINIPADPHHFWCYRMHLNISDLQANSSINNKISNLIVNSGR